MLSRSARAAVTGFFSLTLVCAAIIAALAPMLYFFGVVQSVIAIGVFVGICASVLLGSYYTKLIDRRESKEKSTQYRQFMQALKELLNAVNDELTGSTDIGRDRIAAAADSVREASFYLALTAPDEVLLAINKAQELAPPATSDDLARFEFVQRWVHALLMVRRDCGFSKTELGEGDILTLIREPPYRCDNFEDDFDE
jgi:hypothetical protein